MGRENTRFDFDSVDLEEVDGTATHAVQPFAALRAFEVLPCASPLRQSVSQPEKTVVVKAVQPFPALRA